MRAIAASLRADFGSRLAYPIWLGIALLAAFGGPFGWYEHVAFGVRLLFWLTIIGAGQLVSSVARGLVRGVLGWTGFWQVSVLVAVAVTAVLAPLVQVSVGLVMRDLPIGGPDPVRTTVLVFVISLAMAALRMAFPRAVPAGDDPLGGPPVETPGQPLPRLLRRIDPELRGALIRLSVRDHYVDVVTTGGQTSLLMRLSDAITETEGVEGLQIHRSHWVAIAAIEAVERDGARLDVRLIDGSRLPVSRSQRAGLEARVLP